MVNRTLEILDIFWKRLKTSVPPENAILVTADVVGLYPSIPHQAGLNALKEALENKSVKKIPIENLIKIAEFVLKNNLLEFNNKVFHLDPWKRRIKKVYGEI